MISSRHPRQRNQSPRLLQQPRPLSPRKHLRLRLHLPHARHAPLLPQTPVHLPQQPHHPTTGASSLPQKRPNQHLATPRRRRQRAPRNAAATRCQEQTRRTQRCKYPRSAQGHQSRNQRPQLPQLVQPAQHPAPKRLHHTSCRLRPIPPMSGSQLRVAPVLGSALRRTSITTALIIRH